MGLNDRIYGVRLYIQPAAYMASDFFKHTYGMDLMSSGLFTAVPWLISTISGIVVGGWLVDYLIKKAIPTPRCTEP